MAAVEEAHLHDLPGHVRSKPHELRGHDLLHRSGGSYRGCTLPALLAHNRLGWRVRDRFGDQQ